MIIKTRAAFRFGKYRVRVFIAPGPDRTFQLTGSLTLNPDEYEFIINGLRDSAGATHTFIEEVEPV